MASNNCKLYHQTRRSQDRTEKAREQLLFGGARISGPAAQEYLARSKAADDEWRRKQLERSGSEMHNYGDSWFENLSALATEYSRQKAAQQAAEATSVMHNYGDSWFENLNVQREEYEQRKSEELERQHNYGAKWFDNYEHMWEDWKYVKTGESA